MAFDANFPVTNSTLWSVLYAGLRANFAAIDAKFNSDASWTVPSSFGTGWGIYGVQPAYKKDGCGRVSLRGYLVAGPTPAVNVFQLNSGYRPIATTYFPSYRDSSLNRWMQFYIDTSGYVGYASAGESDWIEFDSISFYVGA